MERPKWGTKFPFLTKDPPTKERIEKVTFPKPKNKKAELEFLTNFKKNFKKFK